MSPHHRRPSYSGKAEYPVFQSAGVQSLKFWRNESPGQGPGDDGLSWIAAQFSDKNPIVDRALPNSSATGPWRWIFINRLGALNQDVPLLRP
jgi:hypothetical protein